MRNFIDIILESENDQLKTVHVPTSITWSIPMTKDVAKKILDFFKVPEKSDPASREYVKELLSGLSPSIDEKSQVPLPSIKDFLNFISSIGFERVDGKKNDSPNGEFIYRFNGTKYTMNHVSGWGFVHSALTILGYPKNNF